MSADVLMAQEIPSDEAARIVGEFASIGMTADLRTVAPTRSMGGVGWLILAALPLQPFFSQLAADAADDVHERLKTFVGRVLRKRSADAGTEDQPRPVMVLQDTVTGVQVILEPDLPAESYQQLLRFDLNTVRHGPLHYDVHRHRWRSELDEPPGKTPPTAG